MAATFAVDELMCELIRKQRAEATRCSPLAKCSHAWSRILGEVADVLAPRAGGLNILHNTPELTVLHVVWAPGMDLLPHNHRMWAAIAVYTGSEDNTFFRRVPDDRTHLVETGGKALDDGRRAPAR